MSDAQRERDGYDDAVDYLTAHPEEIYGAWEAPFEHPAGALFRFVSETGEERDKDGNTYGCLTQIRKSSYYVSCTPELTELIRADGRIPKYSSEITPNMLQPVFAEWNRRIDRELGRTPPPRMKGLVTA